MKRFGIVGAYALLAGSTGCILEDNPNFVGDAAQDTGTSSGSTTTGTVPGESSAPGSTSGPTDGDVDGDGSDSGPGSDGDPTTTSGGDTSSGGSGGDTSSGTELPSRRLSLSFEEGAGTSTEDASGNFTATVAGSPWTTEGAYGGAMLFEPSAGAYVGLTPGDALDSMSRGSVTLWIRCDDCISLDSSWHNILDATAPSCNHTFGIGWRDAQLAFWAGSCFSASFSVRLSMSVNEWHHLAYVVDEGGNRIYLDGERVSPSYISGDATDAAFFSSFSSGNTEYRIGESVVTDPPIRGAIDEVRIYDEPLSDAQVLADMNSPQ